MPLARPSRNPAASTRTSLPIALGALMLLVPIVHAQTPPASPKPDTTIVRTFYLTSITQINEGTELTSALRNILSPDVKLIYLPSQQALTVRATPEELALTQKILTDLDRPRRSYRLTYTITEIDGGKRVGTQHFAVIVLGGGRTALKQGDRVPVATGTYAPNTSGTQTQFTYLDVGLNIDASLDDAIDGVRLRTKVEQSSIAEQTSGVGPSDPIVRQTYIEGTSVLTAGKPLMLGSLDIPGTTRHLDVEVAMEVIH